MADYAMSRRSQSGAHTHHCLPLLPPSTCLPSHRPNLGSALTISFRAARLSLAAGRRGLTESELLTTDVDGLTAIGASPGTDVDPLPRNWGWKEERAPGTGRVCWRNLLNHTAVYQRPTGPAGL